MVPNDAALTVRITCAPGLSDCLQAELQSLGHEIHAATTTDVHTTTDFNGVMNLNLQLRTAFNVLVLLDEFTCRDPDELYHHLRALTWEELIHADGYLTIVSSVNTESISDFRFASLRAKDAIVDRMAEKTGRRPDSGPERDSLVLNLYWHGDACRIYLNTSGRKLSDRGYRRIPHTAPMQETLAAGVLATVGYDGTRPLVNPMCGSGTIAIEAALITSGRAPGLLRGNFGFMHHRSFDADAFKTLRIAARKLRSSRQPAPIVASDIDPRAVEAARRNAETAGVLHLVEFQTCDFAETTMPEDPGIVLLNPEYGERLGNPKELEPTYKRIGDFLKQRCAGWKGYVFTGNLALAKKIGLRATRRLIFHNARIECRLLEYELYTGTKRTTDETASP